jgi:hypothetical protein
LEVQANLLAYIALALTPIVSAAFVGMVRAPISVPIVLLAGQMFLPAKVELAIPGLHPTKDVLPAFGALVGVLIFHRRALARSRPWRGYDLFILVQMLGFVGTTLTNRDPVFFGPTGLPGLTMYDAFVSAVHCAMYWWPPFYLGRTLYKNSNDLRRLLSIVAAAGVIYSVFLFIEMLMSPQLHRWVYGYHQSEFLQTIRQGGYRPKAFMRHGLNVALFVLITVMSATTLARARRKVVWVNAKAVAVYLAVVLVLCKSSGALVFAGLFLPLLCFLNPRNQARAAAIAAVILFVYPMVRASGVIPIDSIRKLTTDQFGGERAGSLAMRFEQEGYIMERALDRIVFGWGGYNRAFRHDIYTGKNLTTIDGQWAIQIGTQGAVGFIALFGMLLLPAWRARRTLAKLGSPRDQFLVSALALMTVAYVMDLIPNSSIDPYLTFLVGALAGTERGLEPAPVPADTMSTAPPRASRDDRPAWVS